MMIQEELLNDAEMYMKENDPKLFMKYIIAQTGITYEVGDLLSVLDGTFLWHSYGRRRYNPNYVKINKDLGDGNFECFDPFYDYKFEAFSEHYEEMGFMTNLTPDDFDDAENDFWYINPTKETSTIGVFLFPINMKKEMFEYIQKKKKTVTDEMYLLRQESEVIIMEIILSFLFLFGIWVYFKVQDGRACNYSQSHQINWGKVNSDRIINDLSNSQVNQNILSGKYNASSSSKNSNDAWEDFKRRHPHGSWN